ncbi:MAG: hypothetical protein QOJ68_3913 [Blastococcus sp.]|jgi:hypothetical protein|nr:hypothetical protein [Blastococcus sp.]
MISTAHDLARVLDQDLSTASRELDEARSRRDRKDTPSNRAAVAAARARIDALLDMYLQAGRPAC